MAGKGVFRRAANVEGRGLRLCGTGGRDARSAGPRRRAAPRHAGRSRVRRRDGGLPAALRPGIRSEVMHQLGATTDTPLAWPSPARAWWTVAVLTFTYIISFVDRTILGLLIEPIKVDLSLNDTQIGLVQGLAFGAVLRGDGLAAGLARGPHFASRTDRSRRRTVVRGDGRVRTRVERSFSCSWRASPSASARPRSPLPRCRSSAIRSRRSGAPCRSACTPLRLRSAQDSQ